MKVSIEEGCNDYKNAGGCAGDELVTWVKAESQLLTLLSREVTPFET